jgi:GNAT superfamily N-acetyltransferase
MHADEITLRLATPNDAEIVAHHRWAMFADMGHNNLDDLAAMDASFLPYVRRALADGSYKSWLACTSEGQVVAGGGLLVYEWPARPGNPDPRRAYLLNVYTETAYRRRGIARRIVTAIIAWCRAEGFKAVSLHASADGRALYESLGFEQTNEMRLKLK